MKSVGSMKLVVHTTETESEPLWLAHPGHEGIQIGLSSPVIPCISSLALFLSGILVTDAEVASCPVKHLHCQVHLTHTLPLSQLLTLLTVPAGRYFFFFLIFSVSYLCFDFQICIPNS